MIKSIEIMLMEDTSGISFIDYSDTSVPERIKDLLPGNDCQHFKLNEEIHLFGNFQS